MVQKKFFKKAGLQLNLHKFVETTYSCQSGEGGISSSGT